jgi:hypothetical protein
VLEEAEDVLVSLTNREFYHFSMGFSRSARHLGSDSEGLTGSAKDMYMLGYLYHCSYGIEDLWEYLGSMGYTKGDTE